MRSYIVQRRPDMARARRGRGEGGVYQRESDSLWVGTVSLGFDGKGKRKQRTVYGKTKAEALGKLSDARAKAQVGNMPDIGSMTTGQVLDRWLDNLKARVGERTHEEKEILVRVHLKPRIGGVKVAKLNGVHVEALAAELRAAEVGPWAARNAIDALDYALTYATRLRLIPANPCRTIDKPRPKAGEIAFLAPDQARLVRETAAVPKSAPCSRPPWAPAAGPANSSPSLGPTSISRSAFFTSAGP